MNEQWQKAADSGSDVCHDSSRSCGLSEATSLLSKASVLRTVISVIVWQRPSVKYSSPAAWKLPLLPNNPEEQGS